MMFPQRLRAASAIAFTVCLTAQLHAGSALAGVRQIREMNAAGVSSDPNIVAKSGGKLFFLAYDGTGVRKLWCTDGTEDGTVMLAPFDYPQYPQPEFADVDGTLFFLNRNAGLIELWKSDGTPGGTVRVTVLPNEPGNIQAGNLTNAGGTLYFGSWTTSSGYDLWKSDGTEAGTGFVADVAIDVYYSSRMADLGGIVYFTSTDGPASSNYELWRSDGTAAGTWRVKDINPGTASSSPENYAVYGGFLYFAATDGVYGHELWRTDGTEAGTTRLTDLAPGAADAVPYNLTVSHGKLYFSTYAIGGVFVTDGTTITQLATAGASVIAEGHGGYTIFGNYSAIYATDGTVAGTHALVGGYEFRNIQALAGTTCFERSSELWCTDGTSEGTAIVTDTLWVGLGEYKQRNAWEIGGKLFLEAETKADREQELWSSDGTTAGTELFLDIAPPPSASVNLSSLTPAVGDQLAFVNQAGSDPAELWLSNGTAAGTWQASSTVVPRSLTAWNDKVVVEGYEDITDGLWLWSTSGELENFYHGQTLNHVGIGDALYFGDFGEVVVSHGASGDDVMLKDIEGPIGCSGFACVEFAASPRGFTDIGGGIIVFSATGVSGPELWSTNGTPGGTTKLADVGAPFFSPFVSAAVGGKLFFAATDSAGEELWTTDGTAAGTARLVDINAGAESSSPADFTALDGKMYFTATDPDGGRELWSSDGTAGGTARVDDIEPGPAGSAPSDLIAFDGALWFAAAKTGGGRELWRYTGAGSPALFADIRSGAASSNPGDFEIGGARMYFRADDGTHGSELWATDGTVEGTAIFADVDPGPSGSNPNQLTRAGRNLFFYAWNSVHGQELWATDIPVDCGNSFVDPYETCDDGNVVAGDGCDDTCILETCGDGTLDDGEQCDDGNRIDGDGCSRGCTVDCLPAPEAGCIQTVQPESAELLMKGSTRPSKSKLSWRWEQGEAATAEELGDPKTDTSYQVCVYDGTGLVLSSNAPAGDLWTGDSSSLRYKRSKDKGVLQIGMRSALMAGDAAIHIKMKGGELSLPDLRPIMQPLVVQVRNANACWDATYSTQFDSQTEKILKARSD